MADIHAFEPLWDDWYIKETLGKGGYGCVYRATREENVTGRAYTYESAIKHISIPRDQEELSEAYESGYVTDYRSAREFYKQKADALILENQLMYKLQGASNVVHYYDHKLIPKSDMPGYDLFIRMELLTPLTVQIKDHALKQSDVLRIGIDICNALSELLEHNVIHRDVKPSNIFVDKKGNYKLGDFGVARQMEKTHTMVTRKGTYEFMAPEVFKGETAGKTVDLYSLGLVLYRMLNSGRGPFLPESPKPISPNDLESAQNRRFMGDALPPPVAADAMLAAIILKACAYRAEDRYQTPKHFMDALIECKALKESMIYPEEMEEPNTPVVIEIHYGDAPDISKHEAVNDPIIEPEPPLSRTRTVSKTNEIKNASSGGASKSVYKVILPFIAGTVIPVFLAVLISWIGYSFIAADTYRLDVFSNSAYIFPLIWFAATLSAAAFRKRQLLLLLGISVHWVTGFIIYFGHYSAFSILDAKFLGRLTTFYYDVILMLHMVMTARFFQRVVLPWIVIEVVSISVLYIWVLRNAKRNKDILITIN